MATKPETIWNQTHCQCCGELVWFNPVSILPRQAPGEAAHQCTQLKFS